MQDSVFLQQRPLCLASSSPRRKNFLKLFGFKFKTKVPRIDETRIEGEDCKSYVMRMANEKARKVQQLIGKLEQDTLILAGDTTVLLEGAILGKPFSAREAKSMLRLLSGKTHSVYTAFTILDTRNDEVISQHEVTTVEFYPFDEDLINWYVATGEGLDKAGGYSIQGVGTLLVSSIQGSYNNVVGFPIEQILNNMLERKWIKIFMPRKQ